ncbi:antitoxin [Roseateles aquatilis]|uniref:Antitoxin n=1 Tax=Roseateles aquatilis TaxID=431061 RepID=A0A246J0Y6_9BURK|nr:type II toxin-antitoxin system Phd/YefM family antitoxin [Roseateles aquatilis]OWQ86268.1 antitoxin [Roseateles aquatilis]
MEAKDHELTVSLSEFKRQTNAVLEAANHRPIAVLRGGKPAFYVMDPLLFEAIMDDLADQDVYKKTIERLAEKSTLIEVDLDDL